MKKSLLFLFFLASIFNGTAQVTLDSSFGNNGIAITTDTLTCEIYCMAIQPDNKIVAAGLSLSLGIYHFRVARYMPDGTLDISFGTNGIVNTIVNNRDWPHAILLQPDGKIIVAGEYYDGTSTTMGNYHCAMVRYNSDGSLDNTFGIGGIVTLVINQTQDDAIGALALQLDGKIVAGGYAGYQILLARFNTDGSLDNSFGNSGKVFTTIESQNTILALSIQTDGKIVAAGSTGDFSNLKFALERYNTDGTLDNSFGAGGIVLTDIYSVLYDEAASIKILPDGKIIAAGYSDVNVALVKYNTDGSLDTSFGIAGKFVSSNYAPVFLNSLAVRSDGKIFVSGSVPMPSFDYGYSLTRFNSDGFPDSSFGNAGNMLVNINTGNDYAQCLLIQPDNKILIAGSSRASSAAKANFTMIRFTSDLNTNTDTLPYYTEWGVFPNPANETITLAIDSNLLISSIYIYDTSGRIIRKYPQATTHLNIASLAKGIYLIKVLTDKETYVKKIVKQ